MTNKVNKSKQTGDKIQTNSVNVKKVNKQLINVKKLSKGEQKCKQLGLSRLIHRKESFQSCLNYKLEIMVRFLFLFLF